MRAMFRKALLTVLLVSVAGIACDDDDTPRPRDGGTDARRDGGTDARDGAAADRTPDTAKVDGPAPDAGAPDRTPDTAVDRPVDTPVATPDAPPDTSPTPDAGTPDTSATPDTQPPMPDAPPDTTPPTPDMAPDMSPDMAPDMSPDTELPDTSLPDAQPFAAINGCDNPNEFEADPDPSDPLFVDWADIYQADTPICLRIEAGDQVAWAVGQLEGHENETFATHPVVPTNTPSPIAGKSTADDENYEVTFPTPGTFGFNCSNHPNMKGVVWVVPAIP
jgi:hypothetical protein